MKPPAPGSLILGFQPSSHGFGWVAFSGPFSIHDWGLSDMARKKNEGCLRKFETLLTRFNPHTFALEQFEGAQYTRSPRIVMLCRSAVALARDRGIEVVIYARAEIRACFIAVGAKSRHEIACAIARSFDMLRHRLPAPRKTWQGPPRRMALFDAAAVVLTHYRLGASTLFEDLAHDIDV